MQRQTSSPALPHPSPSHSHTRSRFPTCHTRAAKRIAHALPVAPPPPPSPPARGRVPTSVPRSMAFRARTRLRPRGPPQGRNRTLARPKRAHSRRWAQPTRVALREDGLWAASAGLENAHVCASPRPCGRRWGAIRRPPGGPCDSDPNPNGIRVTSGGVPRGM